jgi:predicted RNA-binding protein YlxR (DUF448 family)
VIRRSDGTLELGRALPGRGAWLCADDIRCLEVAGARRAFERALKGPVEESSIDVLRDALTARARMVVVTEDGSGAAVIRQGEDEKVRASEDPGL